MMRYMGLLWILGGRPIKKEKQHYHHTYNFWFSDFELDVIGGKLLGDGVMPFPSDAESASSWPLFAQKKSVWNGRNSLGDLVCAQTRGQEQERLRTRGSDAFRDAELMGEGPVDQGILDGVQSSLSGRACFAHREKLSEFSAVFLPDPDREGM